MTVAENAIVVDKNIWLDFYLHERPLHEEAARFIRVAEKHNANLGTPAAVSYTHLDVYKRQP